MLDLNQVKTGTILDLDGAPFEVVKYQHAKLGRGGAILRTTLKNLLTGANIEKTFRGDAKFELADIRRGKVQFLYREGNNFLFMDSATFDQFPIGKEILGGQTNFLTEGLEVEVVYFRDLPININLPMKMKFKVVDAEPAVKGDTITNPSKNAKIETGMAIKVPMFINNNDFILVDTRDGTYIERVNK
ncbi:elongation factor P [Patescibacteria group bacterium]|nr:elongation factor P [Patescibacteria group bacterium]